MKRIAYLDVAKGFTILTVILGHTLPAGTLKTLLYSFHMPLFFFLSGYFFKPLRFPSLIRKNARQLLLPYAFTSLLLVLFSSLFLFLKGRLEEIPGNTTQLFFATLYGSGLDVHTPFFIPQIGAIWFLLALFWGFLLLNTLLLLPRPLPLLILLFVLGLCTSPFFWLPFSFQPAMTATLYLFMGYQTRQRKLLEALRKHRTLPLLLLILWFFPALLGGEIILAGNVFPHIILNLLSSTSGIFTFLLLSFFLYRRTRLLSGYLQWMGSETLLILCAHLLELRLFPWYLVHAFLTDTLCFTGWRIPAAIALCKTAIATAAVYVKHRWNSHPHRTYFIF